MAALRCPSPPLSAVAYGSSIAAPITTVLAPGAVTRQWSPAAASMLSSAKAVSTAPQVSLVEFPCQRLSTDGPLLRDTPRAFGSSSQAEAATPSRGSPTRSIRPPTPSPGPLRSARSPLLAERAPTPSRGSPTRSIRPLTPSPGPSRSARGPLLSQPSSPPLSRIAAAAVGTPLQRQREAVNDRLATPPRSASPSQRSAPSHAALEASVPALHGSQRSPVSGDLRVGSRCKGLYEGEWYVGVVVKTPDDNKDEADPNKRCSWTLQCDVDAVGTLTWARQVVEERFFISSQPHALCASSSPPRAVGESLPTRAATVCAVIPIASAGKRGSVPLQLSNSTKSVASTAMASTATCPPSSMTATLSPRPTPFTSQSSSLAAHLISPRLNQAAVLPRLNGNAELRSASPFAKEQQTFRIVESRAPIPSGAGSLPSRRESKSSRRDRREPARQSREEDKEDEFDFQKIEKAMEELKAFRFSSQDDPYDQCRDAVTVNRESVPDALETATLPTTAPLGTPVQPPSPCSGTDVTVDGTRLTSEVSTTLDTNGTARSIERSAAKLAAAMERVPRVMREVQSDVRTNSGQENVEVGVTKFDGMHLTPLNEKPFQALSSIARQAHSVLIERLTPRCGAD